MTRMRRLLQSGFTLVAVGLVFAANGSLGKSAGGAGQDQAGMEIAVVPDQQQFTNPAIPVVTVRTVSGRSEDQQQYLIKEVILENRSTKDVSSVTVRWLITPLNSRTTALSRGEFSPHILQTLRKTLRAGQRQTLKLSHPKLFDLIQQIPNRETMDNKFAFVIGVAEVIFEDGSSWKEELTSAANGN